MDLLQLMILVATLGVVWWAITSYVPMPPAGKQVLTIAFVVVMVLCLFSFLHIGTSILQYKPH